MFGVREPAETIKFVDDYCEWYRKLFPELLINPLFKKRDIIFDKIEEWNERGITIFKLPCYSPELNLIEILWRFIKYQWIEIDAYKNWQTFVASVENILRDFGKNYVINFV